MKQKNLLTVTLLGGALSGAFLGLGMTRLTPPVKAAPVPAATGPVAAAPAPPTVTITDLFGGKKYPLTLKAEQMDSSFYLTTLVDAQGHLSLYATRGETVTAGGETFLVAYDVPVTDGKAQPPQPLQPLAGTTGQLIYINMHALEAMGGIVPVTGAVAETPAPTAAP